MVCMVCKSNEATVHLTEVVEGKLKKVDLCETCAKAKGVDDPATFSLADLLLGLGASQELAPNSGGTEAKCPTCGFTQADFKKSGRLGCPECYRTFAEGLEGLLKTMHKGTRHIGKVPRSPHQGRDFQEKLKVLQKKLEQAVAEEQFEEAARIRDEIKSVKEALTGALAA